jgi:hypothetical protein
MTQASDSRKAHRLPGGPSSPLTRLTLLRAALPITLQQKSEAENTADYQGLMTQTLRPTVCSESDVPLQTRLMMSHNEVPRVRSPMAGYCWRVSSTLITSELSSVLCDPGTTGHCHERVNVPESFL